MPFQTVPINVAGPSSEHRDNSLSSQFTQNFFPEVLPGGKSEYTIQSFPGQSLDGATTGADRGEWEMQNIGYRVAGNTLYEISSTGTHTARGTITGVGRCTFYDDGTNLVICSDDSAIFNYVQSTQTLTAITDVNIIGSTAVTGINNQAVYTNVNIAAGIDFVVAAKGDPTTASGSDAAEVEDDPGKLIRAYAFEDLIYMFTERTTPLYWNNPSVQPPLDRVTGRVIEKVGLDALHSVAHTDEFVYWLGDDKTVYRAVSGNAQAISTIPVAHAIEGYTTTSDAAGYTFRIEGQNFYAIIFPTADKTWCFSEASQQWFNLSSDTDRGKYNATSHMFVYNKHLLADETNGNLYKLDVNEFTNNTQAIQRIRTLSSIHGGMLKQPGKRLQMSRFEIIMKRGVGIISGQGVDPQIIVEYSTDGGETFAHGDFVKVGRMGQTNLKVEWFSMITFDDLIVRITTSDPVYYSLQTAAIDLRLAGF
jgi:hypothetical protein